MNAENKQHTGIDIGSHSVKMVCLEKSENEVKLIRFGVKRIPREVVAEGNVADPEGLKAAIRDLLREQGLSVVNASVALPGVSAELATVSLPSMGDDELRETIDWECRQRLPFGDGEAVTDYQVLDERSGPGGDEIHVLLAGARLDVVAGYRDALYGSGLTPTDMDVSLLAVANAYDFNQGPFEKNLLFIHAGAEVIEIGVMENGLPVFTRGIVQGGARITHVISQELGVDFDQAESFKIGTDLSPDTAGKVEQLKSRLAGETVSQIASALDDYSACGGAGYGNTVVLSGGGSKLSTLADRLRERLSVEIEYADPFKKIMGNEVDPPNVSTHSLEAAVAVGLALKGIVDDD